jgi:hypothetical protein
VRQHVVREAEPPPVGRGGEGERQSGVPSMATRGRVVRSSPVLCAGRCVTAPLPLLTSVVACPGKGASRLCLAVGLTSTSSISPVARSVIPLNFKAVGQPLRRCSVFVGIPLLSPPSDVSPVVVLQAELRASPSSGGGG